MADVSVEFGAQDVGLDKTLKQVQAEMTKLEGKVKSGELSMTELEQAMKKIAQTESLEKKLQSMDTGFGKIGIAAGLAGAAAKVGMMAVEAATDAARAVVDKFGAAIDLGGKLNDLSSRTGETAGSLLVLERAFTNTGVSSEAVGTSINKMQKFMTDAAQGGSAQSEAMARLGITMGDLAGKTPTEQMGVFASRISSIQDPAQRAEAAMTIFGKSGGELLPILQNFAGELEGAKGQLGSLPGVMDRSAAAFDSVGDSMASINNKVLEFAAGFLEKALPALNTFTSALSGVDAAGWGEAAMSTITRIADRLIGAFKDPMAVIEAYGTSFEVAAKTFGNAFFNTSSTVIDFLIKSFETNLASAVTAYVGSALIDAALTFGRHITEALMTFSAAISEIPGFKEAGDKMFQILDEANTKLGEAQKANMGETAEAAKRVTEEFDKTASKTRVFKEDFFGAEDATKRMNEQMDAIESSGKETRTAFETAFVPATEGAKKVTQELSTQLDTTGKIQAEKQKELQFELDLATAKATGNTAEQKALEERKTWLDAWKKATASGMGEENANAFADAMLRTKQITDSLTGKDIIVTVTTTVEDARFKTLLAEINSATADPHSIEVALKITGQDNLLDARKILGLMENKNIEAAFKASGTDSLENLKLALQSLPTKPQVDLAMRLTKTDNWDSALDQVKNIAPTKEVLLELKENGFENLKQYQDSIKNLANGATAEITAKVMGAEYLDQAKAAVNGILEANGKNSEMKVTADTTEAKKSIADLSTKPVDLVAKFDMAAFSDSLQSLKSAATAAFSEPFKLNLTDSLPSLGNGSLDMPTPPKSETSIFSELKSLVSDIKELVGKIEPKLPVAALSA